MLEPDGRSLLLDALRPPDDYRLDHAVATTFTLHLDTALSVPLSFLPRRLAESGDPIALMEAVRAAGDRLDVFHQAGMVAMPPAGSPILSFLEPVLHAVRRPMAGHLFHPKLWVLRYVHEESDDMLLRLLVPSRNLTNDRSWDLCLQLDGIVYDQPNDQNKAVAELVELLPQMCLSPLAEARRQKIAELADDLRHTFWDMPAGVDDIEFDVLRPGRPLREDFFRGENHLIISPFCTEGGLRRVTGDSAATVVSRQESLDALPAEVLAAHRTLVLDPLTSEITDAGDGTDPRATGLSGLHAKCYALESGRRAWLIVGSANATDNAFTGNVELLVSLGGPKAKLGVAELVKPGSPLSTILSEHSRRDVAGEDDEPGLLDDVLIELASGAFTVEVWPDAAAYGLRISGPPAPSLPKGARLTVAPLMTSALAATVHAGVPIDEAFAPIEVDQISGFVLITAEAANGRAASAVVLGDLIGAPADRLDQIIARQVDSPEKFLRFLALLLGLGQQAWALSATGAGEAAKGKGTARYEAPGLLELVMRALVDFPDRLDDLARLVERLQGSADRPSVLPDGFAEIWSVVDAVRRERSTAA